MQRTAGTLRVFKRFSELQQVLVSEPFTPQPPLTRAVRRTILESEEKYERTIE